jgi:alpha-tubulin suppressor-like RCC1 family protein
MFFFGTFTSLSGLAVVVVAVRCVYSVTLVVTSEGKLVVWGLNYKHQCDVPVALGHSAALHREGKVVCWGDNNFELGVCLQIMLKL